MPNYFYFIAAANYESRQSLLYGNDKDNEKPRDLKITTLFLGGVSD